MAGARKCPVRKSANQVQSFDWTRCVGKSSLLEPTGAKAVENVNTDMQPCQERKNGKGWRQLRLPHPTLSIGQTWLTVQIQYLVWLRQSWS